MFNHFKVYKISLCFDFLQNRKYELDDAPPNYELAAGTNELTSANVEIGLPPAYAAQVPDSNTPISDISAFGIQLETPVNVACDNQARDHAGIENDSSSVDGLQSRSNKMFS